MRTRKRISYFFQMLILIAIQFQSSAQTPTPTPDLEGTDCNHPIQVWFDSFRLYSDNNTTCGKYDNYWDTCLGEYDEDEDIIYVMQLQKTEMMDIYLSNALPDTGLLLDDSCPPGETECIASCSTLSGTSCSRTYLILNAGTYYIMIDNSSACIPQFNFEIYLYPPMCPTVPPNTSTPLPRTPTPTPEHTFDPTPTPEPPMTPTPSPTEIFPTPTLPPEPTSTPAEPGVNLELTSRSFHPGDPFALSAHITGNGIDSLSLPLVTALVIEQAYWFWPGWIPATEGFDFKEISIPPEGLEFYILDPLIWPDTGDSSAGGLVFIGGLIDPGLTTLIGHWDAEVFEYGPPGRN